MESQGNRMYTLQELCRFLIPSVLGTVIFLLPIQWQGNMTILIGIITDLMQKLLAPVITTVVAAAIVLSAVCSTVRRFLKPAWIVESERWESLFSCNTFYYVCRVLGAVFAVMVYFGVGFHVVISPDTGGTMLNLLKTITVWFMAAAFLIVCVVLTGYVKLQSNITSHIKNISDLERQLNEMKLANDETYTKIMSSVDLEEIKRIAVSELGMKYAKEGQVVQYTGEGNDYVRQYSDIPQ